MNEYPYYLIALSAKNRKSLKVKIEQFVDYLKNTSPQDLMRVSYSLLLGRYPMRYRIAFVVKDRESLIENFMQLTENEIYEVPRQFKEKEGIRDYGEDLLEHILEKKADPKEYQKDLKTLAELYCQGYALLWSQLFRDTQVKKIHLPAYPFAKEKYWTTKKPIEKIQEKTLHSLVHENSSTLEEEKFTSSFTGEEFFFKDHRVKSTKILPGVAYLEMMREAVTRAVPTEEKALLLKNVIWSQPIISPQTVHIALSQEGSEIGIEVYTLEEEEVIHCQAVAEYIKPTQEKCNISAVQKECTNKILPKQEIYQAFSQQGFSYGPSHQAVEEIFIGEGKALARLFLPESVLPTLSSFVLHPSLLDGALQATLGLYWSQKTENKPPLPFALESCLIRAPCEQEMWAIVQKTEESKNIQKSAIQLCNSKGDICVEMRGFTSRIFEEEKAKLAKEEPVGTLLYNPVWKEIKKERSHNFKKRLILCDFSKDLFQQLSKTLQVEVINSSSKELEKRYIEVAKELFKRIKELIKSKPKDKQHLQVIVPITEKEEMFLGLSGLLKTAALENPQITGSIIGIEPQAIAEFIEEVQDYPAHPVMRALKGKVQMRDFEEVSVDLSAKPIWKDKGVYLITGGLGGLGLIFAKEIAKKTKGTKLILTGRSEVKKQRLLKEFEGLGVKVRYFQADVTDKRQMNALIKTIQEQEKTLTGILHTAGVIKDNFIFKKSLAEFEEVLKPKVTGLTYLDEVSQKLKPELFVAFSSTSVLGNLGQADYAAANGFIDSYALSHNVLSINWPLWKEGGMRVDTATEEMLERLYGGQAMPTEVGITVLYMALQKAGSQYLVLYGNRKRMRQIFGQTEIQKEVVVVGASELEHSIKEVLKKQVSQILKVKTEDIEDTSEFSEYGFDSITLTEFINQLNTTYGMTLLPTLLFEYPTVALFAKYLAKEHKDILIKKLGIRGQVSAEDVDHLQPKPRKKARFGLTRHMRAYKSEGIAIIGMSGSFPGSCNLDQFWQNLYQGKDTITEIPKSRWDWKEIWGDPAKEVNKSNIKWGGFIEGVDQFDPLFFGISPKEAELMDPQQRLLMEYTWKALEDAGYSSSSIAGSQTGIFAGTTSTGYNELVANAEIVGYTSTGMVASVGPNRMSYFLDVHGPSEPIETACSSSLVAIHRAVMAIETGQCTLAIAGGVNTLITPTAHISFNKAGMLCEDGHCKTFDKDANGYVRGEGVGMLVLKPLHQAEADGDHIYGVIKGSAENHGGRANSLTAPNPDAQAEVIKAAMRKGDIDPATVSYVEAHGTGTSLGDPIEINGLKKAYSDLKLDLATNYCALGSVKTNIGHTELAAGIAGVIKVLLAMKHQEIPASLHCKEINPYIELKDSPFYIVQKRKKWESTIPRRAGISSFGFGGANAHLIIEEYIPPESLPIPISESNPAIIVLSAKTEECLKEQTKQLKTYLEQEKILDLANIAYTLQVGREAMEERLGFVVTSIEELREKLNHYIQGKKEGLYCGQVKRNKDLLDFFQADEETQKLIDVWLRTKKYKQLLNLWVKGLLFDWNHLYGKEKPQRISLPTYPFDKKRYWVIPTQTKEIRGKALHPLIHENSSTIYEEQFTSTFTGDEAFLKDHQVKGTKVLPAVAYLEMMHQVVNLQAKNGQSIVLKNIVWSRPIYVQDSPQIVYSAVIPEDSRLQIEIYTIAEEETIHAQASAEYRDLQQQTLDILALQKKCTTKTLSKEEIYQVYNTLGLDYGPFYQTIEEVYVGDNTLIGKLSLSKSAETTLNDYILHPSLMDGALQATIGFQSTTDTLALPFALEKCVIYAPCSQQMWVVVKNEEKLTIQLCDHRGKICVEMEGFTIRVLEKKVIKVAAVESSELQYRIQTALKSQISQVLKIEPQDIDEENEFSEYGFDSITLTEFANKLNEAYEIILLPTVLFEHPTLALFAKYLAQEHEKRFIEKLGIKSEEVIQVSPLQPKQLPPLKQRKRPRFSLFKERQVYKPKGIAIIGMSGCFPGANNLEQFWQNLHEGKDTITEIPNLRWDWKAIWGDPTKEANKSNVKWGGFIEGFDQFDPLFFGISPKEAELMDPQQRLLMEYTWKALEDAGYSASSIAGSQAGIFVGTGSTGYNELVANTQIEGYTSTGIVLSVGPNRMSYFLNIHGPSEPIETACSSSLVAIHRAVMAIETGQCTLAIAGGVNTIITSTAHISFNKAGMLAEDGHCKTFDKSANGYVRGEGVGMLVLKPLHQAEADGDHIYGVIKGSAENHGGRANSLTAPNPEAQAEVIKTAMRKGDIDPATISYIEAHGTGTSLGDPIEINGLKKAYSDLKPDLEIHTCALGSVKTNIGHTELAAGIAGVIKVLLAMKHREIPASLHCKEINPYIELKNSPFYIAQKRQKWESAAPRRAGISSFGFGGANAHIVIEEYQAPKVTPIPITKANPAIIVLSAKTKEQLQQQVQQLRTHLKKEEDLASIAYTLQVGREAMEERFGVIVSSIDELKKKLDGYLKGKEQQEIYLGRVKRYKEVLDVFKADEDTQKLIDTWIEKKKYSKLLDLWVKGLIFNWDHLYGDVKPRRISLPTYPFAKGRYWVEEVKLQAREGKIIHPLVHENKSNIEELQYVSTFTGMEPFLRDHQVKGTKFLPGVAYLEMMREAVKQASGKPSQEHELILKNVIWSQPISVKESPKTVYISLIPEDGEIALEIYTEEGVHSQAVARYTHITKVEKLVISSIQKECRDKALSKQEIYSAFSQLGLDYGSFHQPLEKIYIGRDLLLGKLNLSDVSMLSDYVLHPSLMDGALQACIGFAMDKLALPFALDECIVKEPCQQQMWVVVRKANNKLNIQLCDIQGNICVEMKGFAMRVLEEAVSTSTLLFKLVWKKAQPGKQEALIRKVFACDLPNLKIDAEQIQTVAKTPEDCYIDIAEQLFTKIKAVIKSKSKETHFLQVVAPTSYLGLSGLLKTATQENPKIIGQLIGIDPKTPKEKVLELLNEYQTTPVLRLLKGKFETQEWEEIPAQPAPTPPWKDKGTYLITGGLGGLGFIFSKEIAKNTKDTTLILTGRSFTNKAKIKELEALGAKVIYSQTDVTDKKQVQSLFNSIKNLTGIIHSAGIIKDNFILKKSVSEFTTVLKPKVLGLTYLDQASKKLKPELFITFSSVAGVLGNLGQADYAVANGYMDAYAHAHNLLSISWPLWKEGGMQIDKASEEMLERLFGGQPLPTEEGVTALSLALKESAHQQLVLYGNIKRLRQFFTKQEKKVPVKTTTVVETAELEQRIKEVLKGQTSKILKVKPDDIDEESELSEYGFDSIMLTEFSNRLNKEYGIELMPTIFLEYPTLKVFAKYLVSEHEQKFVQKLGLRDEVQEVLIVKPKEAEIVRFGVKKETELELPPSDEPTVIVQKNFDISSWPEYQQLNGIKKQLGEEQANKLFFNINEGIARNKTVIKGKEYINFCSYNYLGLSGEPRVNEAVKKAVDKYGSSVSASRVVAGEKPIHRELEQVIAQLIGTEDSIVYTTGHSTNVNTISHLFHEKDLIIHDSLSHNSLIQGAVFSGSMRLFFNHNDFDQLEELLKIHRNNYEKVLVITEGIFSMDGDIPDIRALIRLKKEYGFFVMLDEAHSIGVLGEHGGGIREYFDLEPTDIDIWMGTLSKSFASCGGYIAGSKELIEYLKFTASGFVYSVGISPPNTASALKAIQIAQAESERVALLHTRSKQLLKALKGAGIDTGMSKDTPIIPLITGTSAKAVELSLMLREAGIYALPIVYPAVEEGAARVRLFLSCTHTEEEINYTAEQIIRCWKQIFPKLLEK